MKSLLYPAIALMNRLSFGMKFSLISILFFLPMLVTNYYLVRDSYAQFHATQVELQSLELLQDSLALRGELETLGNLMQINAILGQSGKAQAVETQIADLEKQVLGRLSRLTAVTADEAQARDFHAKRDEMLAQLKAAQAESSLLSKVAMLDKLLGQAQVLSKMIASQAGLSQDSDSAIRQLSELMTTVTPEVTQTLGEGRAMGAYSLGQGFLNSATSTRFEDLLLRLDKLAADYALRLQDALATEPGAQARLGSLAASSQASLKAAGEMFEEQVVMADTLDAPWSAFYEQVSGLMAQTYALNTATGEFLDQQLQQRLGEHRLHMILLVSALAGVFLLIVYLYGGFYASQ